MSKKVKDKKGWVKIVEAFLAILLVAVIIILIVGRSNVREENYEERISNAGILILRDIQLDDILRQFIVDTNGEIDWDDDEFPSSVKERIEERKPSWLECVAKICDPANECVLSDEKINEFELKEENIYTQSVVITSTTSTFNPRQLKLFCSELHS